jgi:hypothetical protein
VLDVMAGRLRRDGRGHLLTVPPRAVGAAHSYEQPLVDPQLPQT